MEIILDNEMLIFVNFFAILGIIVGTIGMIAFLIYFMIRGIIALKGAIVTEKVWRVALREYVEKRNPSVRRVSIFNKKVLTPKDYEESGDNQ